MKRILVVCQYYYPEPFKITEICEELVKQGNHVTVVTGLPNYPNGIIPDSYKRGKRRIEIINNVRIIRTFLIPRGKSIFALGLNFVSYAFFASLKVLFLKEKFDIVFVYQLSPVTMTIPGIIAKLKYRIPLFLYSCDLWPESMKNMIKNEKNPFYVSVKILSRLIYQKADKIGITSEPFKEYFIQQHNIREDKIVYIPQHAENIDVQIKEMENKKSVDFVFMGNIGLAQDINCILSAANKIKDSHQFLIHFVGDGSCLESMKKKTKELNLDHHVIFHGRHPLTDMAMFYEMADACLLTLIDDAVLSLTVPSKLQGYMSAGKPVIGTINGAARELVQKSNCGILANAGDCTSLAKIMKDFIENPHLYKHYGQNGYEYFKNHFSKEHYLNQITYEFNSLLGGNQSYVQR